MISENSLAPKFELRDARGGKRSLDELIAHGPIALAFFHTSCPVCQLSLPFLDRIAAGTGLRTVAISQDDAADTLEFHAEFRLTLPTLLDPHPHRTSLAYGIEHVPSVFVIEADGVVSKAFSGFSKAEFEEMGRRAGAGVVFGPEDRVPVFRPG